jgi:hypothetical protein
MMLKGPKCRYRILKVDVEDGYNVQVEKRVLFIWVKQFRVTSQWDAEEEIRKRIAKKFKKKKELLREYTEADFLVDRLKNHA